MLGTLHVAFTDPPASSKWCIQRHLATEALRPHMAGKKNDCLGACQHMKPFYRQQFISFDSYCAVCMFGWPSSKTYNDQREKRKQRLQISELIPAKTQTMFWPNTLRKRTMAHLAEDRCHSHGVETSKHLCLKEKCGGFINYTQWFFNFKSSL